MPGRLAAPLPAVLAETAGLGVPAVLDLVDRAGGTPLHGDGAATFVHVGQADSVRLRHWMDLYPPVPAFRRIAGSRLWHMTMPLAPAARVEYRLEVRHHGRSRVMLDPLNPAQGHGPFGVNSVATGPGYQPSPWATRSAGAPRGRVVELGVPSAVFGGTRLYRLYEPPGRGDEPIPLVVAHDGSEFLQFAALATVLDNLNAAGHRTAALLVDPGDRLVEYGASERHAHHLVTEALPAVRRRLAVDPTRVVGMGASFGAVAALHAARRHAGAFTSLALLSGSFVERLGGRHRRGTPFAPVAQFMTELSSRPGELPRRMHLSCGSYDGLIADNRRTVAWLRRHGIDVDWTDVPDGHHWGLWRNTAGPALAYCLAAQPAGGGGADPG